MPQSLLQLPNVTDPGKVAYGTNAEQYRNVLRLDLKGYQGSLKGKLLSTGLKTAFRG
jgi:hypothetical protein